MFRVRPSRSMVAPPRGCFDPVSVLGYWETDWAYLTQTHRSGERDRTGRIGNEMNRPQIDALTIAKRWTIPNLTGFYESRQPVVWLLAIVAGLATGIAAVLFRLGIGLVQWPWLRDMSENVAIAAAAQPWWVVLAAPAVGGLLVGLMLQYVLTARRTGAVPDVMEARIHSGRGLGMRQGLANALRVDGVARRRRQFGPRGPGRPSRRDPGRLRLRAHEAPQLGAADIVGVWRRRRGVGVVQRADCRRPLRPGGDSGSLRRPQPGAAGARLRIGNDHIALLVRRRCRLYRAGLSHHFPFGSPRLHPARLRRGGGGHHLPVGTHRHRLGRPQRSNAADRAAGGRRADGRRDRHLAAAGAWRRLRHHRRRAQGSATAVADVCVDRRENRGGRRLHSRPVSAAASFRPLFVSAH